MTYAWRACLLLFPLAASASASAYGCGGSDASFTGSDADGGPDVDSAAIDGAGSDASPGSDGGVVAVDAAIPCPAYAGDDAYCKALVAYCGRCNSTLQPCDIDNFSKCEKYSAAYSKAGRAALVDCYGAMACSTASTTAAADCATKKLALSTPTPADVRFAADTCASCFVDDAGAAICDTEFYVKADGGAGNGVFALQWSDEIVGAMDVACSSTRSVDPDASALPTCFAKFAICASTVIVASLPKDSCTKDGG